MTKDLQRQREAVHTQKVLAEYLQLYNGPVFVKGKIVHVIPLGSNVNRSALVRIATPSLPCYAS